MVPDGPRDQNVAVSGTSSDGTFRNCMRIATPNADSEMEDERPFNIRKVSNSHFGPLWRPLVPKWKKTLSLVKDQNGKEGTEWPFGMKSSFIDRCQLGNKYVNRWVILKTLF